MILVAKNLVNSLHTSVVGALGLVPTHVSDMNQGRFFKNFIGKKTCFVGILVIKEFNTGFESEV